MHLTNHDVLCLLLTGDGRDLVDCCLLEEDLDLVVTMTLLQLSNDFASCVLLVTICLIQLTLEVAPKITCFCR